jgi:hypothetical protein
MTLICGVVFHRGLAPLARIERGEDDVAGDVRVDAVR